MIVVVKKVFDPVVNVIWELHLCHFIHQSIMPDGIKCLTKVEAIDMDKLMGDIVRTVWKRATRVAVVDPDSLKAN